jgi:DNA helicase-2/ATP-dependent DNA helicase PcrA
MTDLSTLLNKEQFEAATAPDGPLLVLAAAGTGKTRTLVYRVVHLLERGFRQEDLLLLTFTNKAAREMLSRVEEVLPGSTYRMWGGTFHSIANRMLRINAGELGFQRDFTILDSDDQKTLMGNCITDLGFQKKEFTKREVILSHLSTSVNKGMNLSSYLDEHTTDIATQDAPNIVRVANKYIERKRELGAMDFDDLLVNALKLLRENPEVRAYYQNRFKHILVDEFQDTNMLQSEFVNILAEKNRNITVVGDDFQCIYSWRGSDFRNIMDFPKRYPDAQIVKLEQNYRSTPEILELANNCIRHNVEQFQKELRPTKRRSNVLPILHRVYRDTDQSSYIVDTVRACLASGYAPSDIAILYRSHFHSIDIQLNLTRGQIPYNITSGTGFFDSAHAKDMLAFYRLIVSPADYLAFTRAFGLLAGVGENTIGKMWGKLEQHFNPASPQEREKLITIMPAKARPSTEGIMNAYAEYFQQEKGPARETGFILNLLDAFYFELLQKNFNNADERRQDLLELAKAIEKKDTLADFLADVAILTNSELSDDAEMGSNKDTILLSTIHQAKGLEWPVVIVPWMSETMFPSAKIEDTNIPEERRLFYVVATRAKERLIFCSPSYKQSYNGDMESLEISCFIKELDESLYEWTGLSRNTILKSGYIPSYGGWSGGASRRNGPSNYGTWSNSRRNKSWW